jgi:hypothetical protein
MNKAFVHPNAVVRLQRVVVTQATELLVVDVFALRFGPAGRGSTFDVRRWSL